MLAHSSLVSALRAALALEFKIPINLKEIADLPPSIILTMVVVGVALGLAWLYTKM